MFADPLYVGYRSYRPDNETVEEVKQKLQENNIDVSQFVEWSVEHCRQEEFKESEEDQNAENGEEKWTILNQILDVLDNWIPYFLT